LEVSYINRSGKRESENSLDISAAELAYLNENEPDEALRKRINDLEDRILPDPPEDRSKKTEIGYYLDALGNRNLKKGDVLYQLSRPSGTDSPYFTDKKTVDMCRGKDGTVDLDKLKKALQIEDKDNSKTLLTEYVLTEDAHFVGGRCEVNFKYGEGSGNQYILDTNGGKATQLLKVGEVDIKNQNNQKGDSIMASNSFTDSLKKFQESAAKTQKSLEEKAKREQNLKELRKKAFNELSPGEKRSAELANQHNERQVMRDQAKKYGNGMGY